MGNLNVSGESVSPKAPPLPAAARQRSMAAAPSNVLGTNIIQQSGVQHVQGTPTAPITTQHHVARASQSFITAGIEVAKAVQLKDFDRVVVLIKELSRDEQLQILSQQPLSILHKIYDSDMRAFFASYPLEDPYYMVQENIKHALDMESVLSKMWSSNAKLCQEDWQLLQSCLTNEGGQFVATEDECETISQLLKSSMNDEVGVLRAFLGPHFRLDATTWNTFRQALNNVQFIERCMTEVETISDEEVRKFFNQKFTDVQLRYVQKVITQSKNPTVQLLKKCCEAVPDNSIRFSLINIWKAIPGFMILRKIQERQSIIVPDLELIFRFNLQQEEVLQIKDFVIAYQDEALATLVAHEIANQKLSMDVLRKAYTSAKEVLRGYVHFSTKSEAEQVAILKKVAILMHIPAFAQNKNLIITALQQHYPRHPELIDTIKVLPPSWVVPWYPLIVRHDSTNHTLTAQSVPMIQAVYQQLSLTETQQLVEAMRVSNDARIQQVYSWYSLEKAQNHEEEDRVILGDAFHLVTQFPDWEDLQVLKTVDLRELGDLLCDNFSKPVDKRFNQEQLDLIVTFHPQVRGRNTQLQRQHPQWSKAACLQRAIRQQICFDRLRSSKDVSLGDLSQLLKTRSNPSTEEIAQLEQWIRQKAQAGGEVAGKIVWQLDLGAPLKEICAAVVTEYITALPCTYKNIERIAGVKLSEEQSELLLQAIQNANRFVPVESALKDIQELYGLIENGFQQSEEGAPKPMVVLAQALFVYRYLEHSRSTNQVTMKILFPFETSLRRAVQISPGRISILAKKQRQQGGMGEKTGSRIDSAGTSKTARAAFDLFLNQSTSSATAAQKYTMTPTIRLIANRPEAIGEITQDVAFAEPFQDQPGFLRCHSLVYCNRARGQAAVSAIYDRGISLEKLGVGANITPMQRLDSMYDYLRGFTALHKSKPPKVHADVKPGNLLMMINTATGKAEGKLIDFNLSKEAAFYANSTGYGTWCFVAPEKRMTPAADMYALGSSMYMLAHLQEGEYPPWIPGVLVQDAQGNSVWDLDYNTQKTELLKYQQRMQPLVAKVEDTEVLLQPDEIYDYITSKLLHPDPDMRWTAEEACTAMDQLRSRMR